MSLFNELQTLMIKYRFRPNKKIAQHFVISEPLLKRMVELAQLEEDDRVLEIGSGSGFLKRELLKKCAVVAVEIDEKLCQLLEKELPKENLRLICGDFLKVELPEFNKVVSLPPYSCSKEIVHRLLECDFDLGIVVFQKEFAEKLVALPGFKEYGALSVATQYSFECSVIQRVPAGFFFPKPKNESCIVRLAAHNRFGNVSDKQLFSLFVKTVFRFKNKNLKNALQKSRRFLFPRMKLSEPCFDKKMETVPLLEEKVNLIGVQEFVRIFNHLAS